MTFILSREIEAVTRVYPVLKAATQESGAPVQFSARDSGAPPVVAAPDRHAANRAFEALTAQMLEYIDAHGIDYVEAAVAAAWQRAEERRTERDDSMARGR